MKAKYFFEVDLERRLEKAIVVENIIMLEGMLAAFRYYDKHGFGLDTCEHMALSNWHMFVPPHVKPMDESDFYLILGLSVWPWNKALYMWEWGGFNGVTMMKRRSNEPVSSKL